MTGSSIFVVTNTYRNGHDNVISPFHVFNNSRVALNAVLETVQRYGESTPRPAGDRGSGYADDPRIIDMAVKNALDDAPCQYCFDAVLTILLGRRKHRLEMSKRYFMSSSDEVCSTIQDMDGCGDNERNTIMVVDVPRGLITIMGGHESTTVTWDRVDDIRKVLNSIDFHDDPRQERAWRDRIVPESLNALREDRWACLERSVEALLDVDPDDDMDIRKRDRAVRSLGGNDDDFLTAVVDAAHRLCLDRENDEDVDPEAYLDQAGITMHNMRMSYLAGEWELLEEKLPDRLRENVVLHGETKNDPNKDSCARWIDILDEDGRSRAHVSVTIGLHEDMLPGRFENRSTPCAFDLDGCFVIKEWATVADDHQDSVPSPICETHITNIYEHMCDVAEDGTLCEAILRAVICTKNKTMHALPTARRSRTSDK